MAKINFSRDFKKRMTAVNPVLGQSVWNFLILFTFIWILLYVTNPEWVRSGEEPDFDKYKASWYAFAIAILTAIVLWLLYWVFLWFNTRKANDTKTSDKPNKAGKSPLEKLQSMIDT